MSDEQSDDVGQERDGLELRSAVFGRLQREGRWNETVAGVRDGMMRECRAKGMSKAEAQAWTYAELDRLYPPLPPPPVTDAPDKPPKLPSDASGTVEGDAVAEPPVDVTAPAPPNDEPARTRDGRLQGLGTIPAAWGKLPGNATLAAEIAWVQAERLAVVEETPSGATIVRLDRASSPAPSMGAIAWLETSIRSYAKYIEVVTKASGAVDDDEQQSTRRERMQIDEIRNLLGSMLGAEGDAPTQTRAAKTSAAGK